MSNNTPVEQSIANARKVSPLRQRMIDDVMGAELLTEHHGLLLETGQLPCPTFWQVPRPLRPRRDPPLSDLLGQGKEGVCQQPNSGGQRALRFLYSVTLKQDRIIQTIPAPKKKHR